MQRGWIAWAWLGEVPTVLSLVGGAFALAAVGLVRKSDSSIGAVGKKVRPGEPPCGDGVESPQGAGGVTRPVRQPC